MKTITRNMLFATLFVIFSVCNAHAIPNYLLDWSLDVTGTNGVLGEGVNEWIDTTGVTYVENTFINATDFTFEEKATFVTNSHDNSNLWDFIPGSELTATFIGTGFGSLSGDLAFETGTLNIYYDTTADYGTTSADFYGASDGDLIGTFSLVEGYAELDGQAVPNGLITLILESTFLRADTWYDSTGYDLSLTDPISWVLGFATTNANLISGNPTANQIDAFGIIVNPDGSVNVPNELWITNNGQYRIEVVPEPSTLLLLGAGLLGLGFIARRKKQ